MDRDWLRDGAQLKSYKQRYDGWESPTRGVKGAGPGCCAQRRVEQKQVPDHTDCLHGGEVNDWSIKSTCVI